MLKWTVRALLILALVQLAAPLLAAPADLPAERMLDSYLAAPDASYQWQRGPVTKKGEITTSDLMLTAQTWHGTTWVHLLRVFRPAQVAFPGWLTMYITGGAGGPQPGKERDEDALGMILATNLQMPVAILYTVPAQPLFGGLTEDRMTTYSFLQYLKDGDPTWPAHFAMTKSAVRALDALQAYARQQWHQELHSFMAMGASKRGWTTWLLAAADPKRVKAIAPLVIDTLKIPEQLAHQRQLWGHYSEAIADFTSQGLTENLDEPAKRKLWTAVDPYTFRSRLVMPKLIVNASNDPFWTTDALNLYWDDLLGPKWVLYAPNSGHGLDDRTRVINSLSAFFRAVAAGKSLPEITWKREAQGRQVTLTITAPEATAARAWLATASNLDFRLRRWQSVPMTRSSGVFTVTLDRPPDENLAAFGEADFSRDGQAFTLSTQPIIARK